jgi:hypothetical protein
MYRTQLFGLQAGWGLLAGVSADWECDAKWEDLQQLPVSSSTVLVLVDGCGGGRTCIWRFCVLVVSTAYLLARPVDETKPVYTYFVYKLWQSWISPRLAALTYDLEPKSLVIQVKACYFQPMIADIFLTFLQ